ncbi:MAG TPA: YqcI/YcgG family protein, partial [Longimicrobium sp.]|nr:YqcI/YcgG family protein [Longimicrobium sp.]
MNPIPDERMRRLAERIREDFVAFVSAPDFSCLGARAALRHGSHRIESYDAIGSADATTRLARELAEFAPVAAEAE